jgi:hypothetical protein
MVEMEDFMSVRVIYQDGVLDEIDANCLNNLLSNNRIKKMLRSEGWISVDTAPMRGRRRRRYEGSERLKPVGYDGPERRKAAVYEGPERRKAAMRQLLMNPLCKDRRYSKDPTRVVKSILHDSSGKSDLAKIHGKSDADLFNCPRCHSKCEEMEILDGSSVGIILLMECSNKQCGNCYSIICDGEGCLERVVAMQCDPVVEMLLS